MRKAAVLEREEVHFVDDIDIDTGTMLNLLGETPEGVALNLQRQGFTGKAKSPSDCVLASYVAYYFPDHEFEVFDEGVEWRNRRSGTHGSVPLPQPARDFMLQFDMHTYPHLETGRRGRRARRQSR